MAVGTGAVSFVRRNQAHEIVDGLLVPLGKEFGGSVLVCIMEVVHLRARCAASCHIYPSNAGENIQTTC